MFKRLTALFVCIAFSLSNFQYVYGEGFSIDQLPVPGEMVGTSLPFSPLAFKGLIVDPQKPLQFQFIVDTGSARSSQQGQLALLIKYFLAGLTIPNGDLWVNLSPYEKDRMVPQALGQTGLGRDLLAQDYILKQLTASLIYPEKELGKEFWSKVYSKAQAQFGTTNIPVNTFNKVWILPDQAQVFENGNAAYVTRSTLKVMLDEDYLALKKHMPVRNGTDAIGSNIVRQIILPEIEKEVNTGKNFAPLRQIYQALILAKWYKETIQNGLIDTLYTNKKKVTGVDLKDPAVKEQIYQRYLQAYKKGVFNYIKEDSTPDGRSMSRKYFSGGTYFGSYQIDRTHDSAMISKKGWVAGTLLSVIVSLGAASRAGVDQTNPPQMDHPRLKEDKDLLAALKNHNNPMGQEYAAKMLGEDWDTEDTHFLYEEIVDQNEYYPIRSIIAAYLKKENRLPSEIKERVVLYLLLDDEKSIVKMGSSAVPALLEELNNEGTGEGAGPDWGTPEKMRELAAKALGDIGDKSAIPGMVKALNKVKRAEFPDEYPIIDENLNKLGATWWDRQSLKTHILIWLALAGLGSIVYKYVKYKKENIRVGALKFAGSAQAIAEIMQEAEEKEDYRTYNTASDALNSMGDPRGDHYYKYLEGNDGYELQNEIDEHGNAGGMVRVRVRESVPPSWSKELRGKSSDKAMFVESQESKDAAMIAITKIVFWTKTGDMTKIEAMLGNENEGVRRSADRALRKLGATTERMIDAYIAVLSTGVSNARLSAINKLREIGGARAAGAERIYNDQLAKQMLQSPHENGGIDLNQINVSRTGRTIDVKFDPAELNALMQGGFEGFAPVIIKITPIQNPLSLLGVNPVSK